MNELLSTKRRLLICGRSGAGKSSFSNLLRREINCFYFNADLVREVTRDNSFDMSGRIRQAKRMRFLADYSPGIAVCDFICPTPELRSIFAPDIIIYVQHPGSKRYEDTDKLFVPPQKNEAAHVLNLERGRESEIIIELLDLLQNKYEVLL